MGSFADGMRMGQGAYQQAIDNERQAAKDERDKILQGREDTTYARNQGLLAAEDAARAEVTRLQTTPDQAAVTPLASNFATAGLNAARDADTLTGYDGSAYTAPMNAGLGLKTNAAQPTKPGASPLQMEKALGNWALARGDSAGVSASIGKQRDQEYDNAYAGHLATWNDMKDDQKKSLLKTLSYDTGVKGFGTWVAGTGKKEGYMQYLPEGGDPVALNNREASQLYALTNLMQTNPTRARAEMDKVSDKVATLAEHAFDRREKGIAENNKTQMGIDNRNSQERSYRYLYGGRGGAGAGKEVSPETTAAMNDIVVKFQNSTDPKERALLEKQYNMLQGQAANQLGKPMQLRTDRPTVSPEDTKEFRTALMELGPRPTGKTGLFGGKDDAAGLAWDAKKTHIGQVFGSPGQADQGGGLAVTEPAPRGETAPTPKVGLAPPSAPTVQNNYALQMEQANRERLAKQAARAQATTNEPSQAQINSEWEQHLELLRRARAQAYPGVQ